MAGEFKKDNILNNIKLWVFPSLVTVLSLMIWRDINEMRADVKMLLAQSNVDKTKIENLERDVRQIENQVFNKKVISQRVDLPWFLKIYFKPEEEFDVKKYVVKTY